jgi:hypothetical protein
LGSVTMSSRRWRPTFQRYASCGAGRIFLGNWRYLRNYTAWESTRHQCVHVHKALVLLLCSIFASPTCLLYELCISCLLACCFCSTWSVQFYHFDRGWKKTGKIVRLIAGIVLGSSCLNTMRIEIIFLRMRSNRLFWCSSQIFLKSIKWFSYWMPLLFAPEPQSDVTSALDVRLGKS